MSERIIGKEEVTDSIVGIVNRVQLAYKFIKDKKVSDKLPSIKKDAMLAESLISDIELLNMLFAEMSPLVHKNIQNGDGILGFATKKQSSVAIVDEMARELEKQLEKVTSNLNKELSDVWAIRSRVFDNLSVDSSKHDFLSVISNMRITSLVDDYRRSKMSDDYIASQLAKHSRVSAMLKTRTKGTKQEGPYQVKNGTRLDEHANPVDNYDNYFIVEAGEAISRKNAKRMIASLRENLRKSVQDPSVNVDKFYKQSQEYELAMFSKDRFSSITDLESASIAKDVARYIELRKSIEQYKKISNLLVSTSRFKYSKIIDKLEKEIEVLEQEQILLSKSMMKFRHELEDREKEAKKAKTNGKDEVRVEGKKDAGVSDKKSVSTSDKSKASEKRSLAYREYVELRKRIDDIRNSITYDEIEQYAREVLGVMPAKMDNDVYEKARKELFERKLSRALYRYGNSAESILNSGQHMLSNVSGLNVLSEMLEMCKQELSKSDDMYEIMPSGFSKLEEEYEKLLVATFDKKGTSEELKAEIGYYLEQYNNIREEARGMQGELKKQIVYNARLKYFSNTILASEMEKLEESKKGRR